MVELVEGARNPATQPLPALLGSPFELGVAHDWNRSAWQPDGHRVNVRTDRMGGALGRARSYFSAFAMRRTASSSSVRVVAKFSRA